MGKRERERERKATTTTTTTTGRVAQELWAIGIWKSLVFPGRGRRRRRAAREKEK